MQKASVFGRYREIVIAVALFLVLDLGVLILNFYTSFKISEDAAAINVAGRQRMLSQRIAKISYALEAGPSDPKALNDELKSSVALFDVSLKAFVEGGETRGGDGKPLQLAAVSSPSGQAALRETQALWALVEERAGQVGGPRSTAEDVKALGDAARANNLKLLAQMNNLTTALEADAAARADFLRLVQAIAIVLALLNFAYILFKFIRRLRATDDQVAAVSQERQQILTSVREGLFLIDPKGAIGTQISDSVGVLLGVQAKPGQSFFELLAPMVTPQTLQDSRDYVEMLLAPRVKEALVQSLNPLASVSVNTLNSLGQPVVRQLSFAFTRVLEEGNVKHLLATVQDVSAQAELQKRLATERERAQHEFSLLIEAVKTDRAQLQAFAERATEQVKQANALLREMGQAATRTGANELLRRAQRCTHAIKGDASSIGLELIAGLAHRLESQLQEVFEAERVSPGSAGQAMVALPIALEDLQTKLDVVQKLAGATEGVVPAAQAGAPAQQGWQEASVYSQLAAQVAKDLGKEVLVTTDMPAWKALSPQQQQAVHDITVQLVRNAVVHGVGEPAARRAALKPAAGRVDVVLFEANQHMQLVVRDDGTGLVQSRLRQRLVDLGWFSSDQVKDLSDNQVLAQMFKPGFSTAQAPSESKAAMHGGRGVGLDLVNSLAQGIGGRIGISTQAGRYSEFRVSFPSSAVTAGGAA